MEVGGGKGWGFLTAAAAVIPKLNYSPCNIAYTIITSVRHCPCAARLCDVSSAAAAASALSKDSPPTVLCGIRRFGRRVGIIYICNTPVLKIKFILN